MTYKVYTDASYSHEYKAAGIACFIQADNKHYGIHANVLTNLPNISYAESAAIGYGIDELMKAVKLNPGDIVAVYSDSYSAISFITTRYQQGLYKTTSSSLDSFIKPIFDLKNKEVVLTGVKVVAHSSYINANILVDKAARAVLKDHIVEANKE